MNIDRRFDLNNAILMYICECQAQGDIQALTDLGLDNDTVESLRSMTVGQVVRISKIKSLIARVKVDGSLLSNLINHARREDHQQNTINDLIKADAPVKLMQALYGINSVEFSARRQNLQIKTLGRTKDPTHEEETLIFETWKHFDMRSNLEPHEWLEFHRLSQLPIRLIYKVIYEEDVAYGQTN